MKHISLTAVQMALLLTADYIEQRGWCQHTCRDPEGRVCASYALAMAGSVAAQMEFERRVGAPTVWWNDQPGRTKEEIIAVMRCLPARAADTSAAKGQPSAE